VSADLAARALATNQALLALGHEVFESHGARFVRNVDLPDIWDANHIDEVTASSETELDALLGAARDQFPHCTTIRFDIDFRTPPQVEARLEIESFQVFRAIISVLDEPLAGEPRRFEIQEVGDDNAGWAAFTTLKAAEWPGEEWVADGLAGATRLKCPPLRLWLGLIDGEPRGYLTSWGGTDGMGQVEDLLVDRRYRHRGLATALIHRGVESARADGARAVVIGADAADTPKHIYRRMGWRPVAVKREYRKASDAAS
jgi:ribosomal protein S18 acetylase RimI-like enzyme